MTSLILQAAMQYHERGYNVLAVRPDKKPYELWERLQRERVERAELEKCFKQYPAAMVGIVTGKISGGLCAVDCDSEIGEAAFINALPADQAPMPRERTPRGGGHFFFRTNEPLTNAAGFMPDVDFRGNGGYIIVSPSRNEKGAYTWGRNASLLELEPPSLPDAIASALARASYSINKNSLYRGGVTSCNAMFAEGRRDNDLFHIANTLVKGGMPEHEILQVLENLVISWGEKPDQKWITDKIKSALKRAGNREASVSDEVQRYVSVTEGYFSVTDCYQALQSVTDNRTAVRVALHRLCEKKVIERTGPKDGVFRRVDDTAEEIDFINCPTETVNIRYPLSIEGYVKTLPKNIIVIAGEINAGKTAFLLRLAAMNQHKHEIHYFSSEMGQFELRERLSKFEIPLESWRVKFKERAGNFADVIQPDAINIVDFLELHDDFYKVGLYIKEIFDKLNKGVCIIALQKNKGTDHGLGGARSIEKARLYVAMEAGKMKIVKAKNWQNSEHNPNGLEINFKLAAGCKFVNESPWHKAA